MSEKVSADDHVVVFVSVALLCGFLFGNCVFGWQVLLWLKNGQWHSIPVSCALDYLSLPYPDLEWRGALSVVSFAFMWVVFGIVLAVLDELRKKGIFGGSVNESLK